MKKQQADLLETQIQEIGEREVAKFLKDLRPTIRARLDAALSSLLGISNSWGRPEIDHCNGRNSVITKAVEQIALQEVRQLISKKGKIESYLPFAEKCLEEEIKGSIQYAIEKEVEEQIRPLIRQTIAERLPAKVKEVVRIVLKAKPEKGADEELPI